jgi:hypothetical protein
VIEQDEDSTGAIYGSDPSFHAVLSGKVRAQFDAEVPEGSL